MNTKTGKVKMFNQVKGHGFIVPDEGGQDVFVHYTNVDGKKRNALNEGDSVSYEVTETNKGPAALSVARR
ncbi:cold-shock DNA-binding domain protein [Rhizoctonia solani AG-3 Rhs1AP]|uniref:Cold-shock DNA-binding domain protein n=2 Tax=Rhizoctonia solani AG-3 TaxID=1086053 RepID=A0A074RRC4_9AGAM|nr:cold-shock DNA-binding domain protein [Rhizoctonia solani AG-3 Rhs1AP]KEP47865.1 cold-shock DNA-binding domain protein [Rhizoctonia solani 123E]